MNRAEEKRIGHLIDQVLEAVDDPAQQARAARSPRIAFATEEPVCWAKIFGFDARRYFAEPAFYFETVLRQKLWRWRHFPADQEPLRADVPAWLGHYPEYTFVGLAVTFTADGVPVIQTDHPLTKRPDLAVLEPVDFTRSGWMPRLLRWYEDLVRIAAGRVPVTLYEETGIWWRGGLDLAIALRGYENFVLDTLERPHFVRDLMQWLTDQRCSWYEAYYRHFHRERGPVFIGDDWINVPFITPDLFADVVLPSYRQIEAFHGGIRAVHSCGNQVPVQKDLLTLASLTDLEISPWSDLRQSLANIPQDKNLHVFIHANSVLCATRQQMRDQLEHMSRLCRGRRVARFGTSGLAPLSNDHTAFTRQVRAWTEVALETSGSRDTAH
jgi:hypothetical protein